MRHLSNLGLGTKKILNFTPSTPQKRADVRNYKKGTMDLDSTGQGLSTDMFNLFIAPIFAEIRFFCEADHTGSPVDSTLDVVYYDGKRALQMCAVGY